MKTNLSKAKFASNRHSLSLKGLDAAVNFQSLSVQSHKTPLLSVYTAEWCRHILEFLDQTLMISVIIIMQNVS